jgi:hypothetical protein
LNSSVDWDKHLPSILAWGGSVVTGIFTLLGVWFANRSSVKQLTVKLQHESDRESREALRTRLEELYSLVSRWAGQLVVHHATYRKVMEGELSYNDALNITINSKSLVDANRMFTLAELYFPSAHGALQEIKALRDEASSIQEDFKHAYKRDGQPSIGHARALNPVLDNFNLAISKYLAELSAHAKDV